MTADRLTVDLQQITETEQDCKLDINSFNSYDVCSLKLSYFIMK